ncbi:phosphoenolpyruvate synthase [Methanocella arvoryzae]|uniref:Phosphoenolpyruvate synthase n=1 Tax=Methanocella arvoryzae (strain DSM 22066 / NBRC 105507 / MRE50) TaxID=351160 RepID=Q0W499_METAR|nr:phosphoenolpyruvate synthase [Methanocella arvoryzae]CAJ36794.1 phosphoenolpyruvate synthetase (PEP synthase) [Methanocella arvoryzae MRE50]
MAGKEKLVVWLNEVRNTDIPIVGGKGASLGEMTNAQLPVPPGFVVTAQAFRKFIVEAGIVDRLFKGIDVNVDDQKELMKAEKFAKDLINSQPMPASIAKEITAAYETLCKREGGEQYVAARSSATAEDLPDASFAGQQETFLNVKGKADLLKAVQHCWASLYGARAIYYRVKQKFPHEQVNIAVVVQKMVDADSAGVMFTHHPTTGEDVQIIEAAWGLGESVVSGAVSPDNYEVKNDRIVKKKIATKQIKIIRDPKTRKTVKLDVEEGKKNAQVLADDQILRLARLGNIVEEHYGKPQDIEWAFQKGELYLLQSRPITTIQKREAKGGKVLGEIILEGLGASPGIASGKVKIVDSMDALDKVLDGDILVTKMTTPDMVPAMKRSAAIITDEGGMTCHAAIVSRELGTPAVVGTKEATRMLEDGSTVTVDGEKGHVYMGAVKTEAAAEKAEHAEAAPRIAVTKPITATEVKVNVSIPEAAGRAKETQADGVGLLRIEHMILGLNTHPQVYINTGRSQEYVDELVKGIRTVADAFYPKPVWVRTLDAPTDEFKAMKGGENEPFEHNPMLGMRGIRRDLKEVEHFKLEMAAFKKLFEMGYDNIGIMIPLVQHPSELRRAKEIMTECGIDLEKVDVGIMVEIPASALIIDEFIKEGIDFVSFGTNDLTQYTLAVDRNNELVADLYNELHPAVLKLIEYVIGECNKAGVKTSICGQAGSRPEVARRLVAMGITSISANIDAVESVREMVARTEHALILEAARKKL